MGEKEASATKVAVPDLTSLSVENFAGFCLQACKPANKNNAKNKSLPLKLIFILILLKQPRKPQNGIGNNKGPKKQALVSR